MNDVKSRAGRKVAVVDCDIIFENCDWVKRAAALLDSHMIVQLFEEVQLAASPVAVTRSRPLAHAVHRQHSRALERRREEGGGRVRLVVLGEENLAAESHLLRDLLAYPELLAQPQRHRHAERAEAFRHECQVGFEKALEFEKGLLVEGDCSKVL